MKHGMTLESEYPYKPATGTCQPDKITPVASITGYCRLPHVADNYTATQQYNDLMNAVIHYGPVAISAAAEPWQLYERGVYDGNCGADVDHAIQLVGPYKGGAIKQRGSSSRFRQPTHTYMNCSSTRHEHACRGGGASRRN